MLKHTFTQIKCQTELLKSVYLRHCIDEPYVSRRFREANPFVVLLGNLNAVTEIRKCGQLAKTLFQNNVHVFSLFLSKFHPNLVAKTKYAN